jgi:hypothetical protein
MISLDEVSYLFEIPLEDVPESVREELVDEVGAYLVESILDYVGEAKSPVAGGKYKATLNQAYADREKAGDDTANLDLNGDMLQALTFEPDYENGTVKIGIFDSSQTPKAYNHNVGDTLPQRQFIPKEDELLKAEIIRGVKRIIEEYKGSEDES